MKGNLEITYRSSLSYFKIYFIILLYYCSYVKLITSNNYYPMKKCCLSDKVISGRTKVDCITEFDPMTEFYSYSNIVNLETYLIPKCKNSNKSVKIYLNGIHSDDLNKTRACLDIDSNEKSLLNEVLLVLVYCHLNDNNTIMVTSELSSPIITTATIRKCCPKDMVYDPLNKSCTPLTYLIPELQLSLINNTNDTMIDYTDDIFLSLLPNINRDHFLAVTRGPPYCKSAIFDFNIHSKDLIYDNGFFKTKLMSPSQNGFTKTKEEIALMDNNSCIELTPETTINNGELILRSCYNERICLDKLCIRKCCPENEMLVAGIRGCTKFYDESYEFTNFHQEIFNMPGQRKNLENGYGLLVGVPCGNRGMYFLGPDDNFSITSKGYINMYDHRVYNHHEYCMEFYHNITVDNFYTFICFEEPEKACLIRCEINTILELISCGFLLVTLVVYACLPVLQNLHGKTLMCHVASLFCAFLCLAIINWVTPEKNEVESVSTVSCKVLGYAMLFSFLSAFSWLNVMCFDIWWTFGGSRGSTSTRRRGHRKRFLLYCAYAWGLACLITVIVILVDYIKFLPPYLTPAVGLGRCWFTSGSNLHGELMFFIGPVTFLLIINIIFFVITSINCSKVKAEIDKVIADPSDARNKRYQADRVRLMMNIKLFIVMGISWILEIISYFINNYAKDWKWREEFFYLPDTFNCLQGLAIFFLFVLKKRVYYALRKRLGFRDKRSSSNATTALHDTCRVNKSASNSTLMSTFQVSSTP